MTNAETNEADAKLLQERNAEVDEALRILGAGEKETLKGVATRRMWQAMPEAMRQKNDTAP